MNFRPYLYVKFLPGWAPCGVTPSRTLTHWVRMTMFGLVGWGGRSIAEWDGQSTMFKGQNHCYYSNSNDPCWWGDPCRWDVPCSLNDWQSTATQRWFGSLRQVIIWAVDIERIASLLYLGIFGLLSRCVINLTKTLLMMSLISRWLHHFIVNRNFTKDC